MHWNYRIIHFDTDPRGDTVGVFEVHYNDDGSLCCYSAADTHGYESTEDVLASLEEMLADARRAPVLLMSEAVWNGDGLDDMIEDAISKPTYPIETLWERLKEDDDVDADAGT